MTDTTTYTVIQTVRTDRKNGEMWILGDPVDIPFVKETANALDAGTAVLQGMAAGTDRFHTFRTRVLAVKVVINHPEDSTNENEVFEQ